MDWTAVITERWPNDVKPKMTVLTETMEAAAPVLEGAELVCFTNTLAQGLNQAGSRGEFEMKFCPENTNNGSVFIS